MASNGPRTAPRRTARRRPTPPSPGPVLAAVMLTGALLAIAGAGAASAASAPSPGVAAPCVFWGEAHSCQSTDPTVTLEVINEHETSQCVFHESWTWGDGTANGETTLRGSIEGSTQLLGTHTYTQPGTYRISVSGNVVSEEPGLDFVCEVPPVEYAFTLVPPAPGSGGVLGVKESREASAPPLVSGFTQSHPSWRAGSALARLAGARGHPVIPVGTIFSFNLNQKAAVTLSFVRETLGRRVAGRCAPASSGNRARAHCRLARPAGALSFTAHPGRNRAFFDGRISLSQALVPGSYGLTLTATNAAGRRATPRSLHFTVLR